MIAAILQAHGFRVGSYFSPYVYDVRERIQINAHMIPRNDFAALVAEVIPHVEAIKRQGLDDTTEFELKTAVAFKHFADERVDFAAVEVGIGGRLDATNIVDPLVTVITNIGLDHTHILGDTHEKIAGEKAGIIKPGIPIITATDDIRAREVIKDVAQSTRSPLLMVVEDRNLRRTGDAARTIYWVSDGEGFDVRTPFADYKNLRARLRGEYQKINAACAIAASEEVLRTKGKRAIPAAVREGLAAAYLPGRTEIVRRNPTVILDGAHNALAAGALKEEILKMPHERLFLVIGMVGGHSPRGVLAELAPIADKVYVTEPSWMRRTPAAEIAEAAKEFGRPVEIITPPIAAARAALKESARSDLILITGSFYVVGDIAPEELSD
jgi:dihydrofolate synthase/folylpolyglutamate synthase